MVATPSTGAYKSVGSFVAIGQAFPGVWNWSVFFQMLAMLSVMLAIMNLLPQLKICENEKLQSNISDSLRILCNGIRGSGGYLHELCEE